MAEQYKAPQAVLDFIQKDISEILSVHLNAWCDDFYGMIRGVLMYSGQQWLAYDNGQIVNYLLEDQDAAKLLYTDNYMKPLTDQLISRIITRNVTFKTKPASQDEIDIQRSKANNKILSYVFEQRRVRAKLRRRAQFIMQMGRAYISSMPDFNSGVMMPDEINQAGVPYIDVHSPLEVQHQMEYEENQRSPYMVRWRTFLRKDAERRFGRTFTTQAMVSGHQTPLSISSYLYDTSTANDFGKEQVMLPELWIHPLNGLLEQKDNPKGLTILFDPDRNEAIEIAEWPYPFSGIKDGKEIEPAHYPFHDCAFATVLGTAHALGACQLLEDKQRDLNRVETMIRWHVNISASPILHDPDSGATEEDRTIEAGAIWHWNWQNGQPPPGFLQPPQLGGDVVQLPAQIKNDMREEVMVRFTSLASGEDATSGVMAAQLQAQDNQNFSHFYVADDDALTAVCRDVLKETHTYMPPSFKLDILGHRQGQAQLDMIQSQMIEPMVDVIAVADPFSWMNSLMREQQHAQRVNQGLETPEQFAVAVDGRDPDEGKFTDLEKARYENDVMLGSDTEPPADVPPPGVADNDDVHLEQHGEQIRGVNFLHLDPTMQARLSAHWTLHDNRKKQRAAEAAALQSQPMGGTAKPPPNQKPGATSALGTVDMPGMSNLAKANQAKAESNMQPSV